MTDEQKDRLFEGLTEAQAQEVQTKLDQGDEMGAEDLANKFKREG
jgi:hypothetical protein